MKDIDLQDNFLLRPKIFLVIDTSSGKAVAMRHTLSEAAAVARWMRLKDHRIEER